MSEAATTLAGARKGRPSILRRWVGQALARNLSCLVVPGPEVALAHGLDLAAADMRIAATPRDATVLLIVGELSQKLDEATAVLYAQMPRPRAILVLGGSAPSSLPQADVSADLSQTELMEAATRLQRLLAEDAFAASPDDFDSSILQAKTEYVCPMHPEVVEDEPGSCPKCGMDLVAREAGGDSDAGEHDHDHDHEHEHHGHEHDHDHEHESEEHDHHHAHHNDHGQSHEHHHDHEHHQNHKRAHDHEQHQGDDDHEHAHCHEHEDHGHQQSTAQEQSGTEYICPMHPEIRQNEPGSCPKCGMDLEPHKPEEDEGVREGVPEHDHEHHHDHSGHDHDGHDHSDHDHDSSGFMSMVEVTKDLPRSADGLAMDWLEVPFGPCFPGLPGGLRLTLTLDGDGVTEGQATSLVAMGTPSEEVAVETFIERLAAAMPLAPVSYRLLACRAIEQAAGLEPDPAVERGRAAALERERIASHLGWLAQLGRQLSFVWLTRRAAALQLETQRADREQLVALRPALQSLIARLEHTPLLKARLKGIGALPHGSQDLRGPVARASGRTEDARQADAMYRELGFEMRAESAGDAWARLRQRHVEIMTSLDLVEVAGDPELPKLRAIDNPSGTGEATVETPRGRATLRLTQERGQVVSVELDSACSQHIGLVADLVEGQELGDALVAVGSLDLSPWEVTS